MRTLFRQCQTYLEALKPPDNPSDSQAPAKDSATTSTRRQTCPNWPSDYLTPKKIRNTLAPDATPVHQMSALTTTLKEAAPPWRATIALFWYRLIDTLCPVIPPNSPAGDTPQLTRSDTLAFLFSGKTFEDLCNPDCRKLGWQVIDNASSLFLSNRRFQNELVQLAQALLVASVYSDSDNNGDKLTIEKRFTQAWRTAWNGGSPNLQHNHGLSRAIYESIDNMKGMVEQLKAAKPHQRPSVLNCAVQDVLISSQSNSARPNPQ